MLIDAMETVIAHEETGSTSVKRATTGGTQDEASSKKTKSNMTTEQETFVQKFKAAPSKVDKLGFGRLIYVCNYPLSCFESRFTVNNRLLIT